MHLTQSKISKKLPEPTFLHLHIFRRTGINLEGCLTVIITTAPNQNRFVELVGLTRQRIDIDTDFLGLFIGHFRQNNAGIRLQKLNLLH